MSVKILFADFHQDIFPGKYRALDAEYGEYFRHDIAAMEMTYQGKWISPMITDCCWIVTRDSPGFVYKRLVKRQRN
jgi:hypothetical protein